MMYLNTFRTCAAAGFLACTLPAAGAAQAPWNWEGRLSPGQTVEIVGISGDVQAVPARGQARVRAAKTVRRGSADDVPIVAVEHAGGVTICAIYPARDGQPANVCEPGGGSRNSSASDITVDFHVEVPAGVHFTSRTVSGDISAAGLSGDVRVTTVSGDVDVQTSGTATASTVNGSIDVNMGRAEWRDRAAFSTVNGNIRLSVAGELDAELRASTVNGEIQSTFPIVVEARHNMRNVTQTLGRGGPELRLSTVNGSIELRRR
jgi:hypothetical protein